MTKICRGRDKEICWSLCFLLLCHMVWRSMVLWAKPEPAIQYQKVMVMGYMIFSFSLFFVLFFWELQTPTDFVFHLREAASAGVKLSKVVSRFERPCRTLTWWAEERESAATRKSHRESCLTNHPLWWTDFHSEKALSSLCQQQGVHNFSVGRGAVPQSQTLWVVVSSFTQSKFTAMGDLGKRLKGRLTRELQCLLTRQRGGPIITCLFVFSSETSIITLACRAAYQSLGCQFSLGWRSYC